MTRRQWLVRVVSSAAVAAAPASGAGSAPAGREVFMRRAFELRRLAIETGDQPYGAVVVRDGRVVGEPGSHVVTRGDPTAHAEMEAVRAAARRLGIYATSRPCRMCEAACYWANVARVYYGSEVSDAGAPRLSC